jgi:hypothetical protein
MATKTAKKKSNLVVARDAIVITVGARPIEYGTITVINQKTGLEETIDNHNVMVDEGDEGVPYTFKAFQKVNKNHVAVKACPGAFMPLDEVDEADLIEV